MSNKIPDAKSAYVAPRLQVVGSVASVGERLLDAVESADSMTVLKRATEPNALGINSRAFSCAMLPDRRPRPN